MEDIRKIDSRRGMEPSYALNRHYQTSLQIS